MEKPLPKRNPLEMFASSEPVVIEIIQFFTPQEYDSEDPLHLYEGEQSSSPSIEFEPLPTGPYHVALDHE
jgi:hypothetical protein